MSSSLTWWQFRPEHLNGYNVDAEDPDWTVKDVARATAVAVAPEGDDADALGLQLAAVGVGALQFAAHVLLELLHVENLKERRMKFVCGV